MASNNDFDEFASIAGSEAPEIGWWVYFDKKGFIRGVQSPFGIEPDTYDHYREIHTFGELYSFLKLHNRVDLMSAIQKTEPEWRGQKRKKVPKGNKP